MFGGTGRSANDFARAALERYGLQDADLTLLKEGSATLFRVAVSDQEDFLLRIYAPLRPGAGSGYGARRSTLSMLRTEPAIRSQAIWLHDLRQRGWLPVPEVIPTSEGELVGDVVSAEGEERRIFFLIRWIGGELKKDSELTLEDARALGRCAARLHQHAEHFDPPENFVRPRWDWESLFDPTATYWEHAQARLSDIEMDALRSAGERIKEDLQEIGESRKEFGIIHRDLQSANVIFNEGNPHIIDFDHCGWGHYMYDLALPYLHLERLGKRCSRMREALMEGYLDQRALPSDYRETLETFVHMHVMNKLIRTVVKFPDRTSELHGGVARLARFASTPRTL